MMTKKNIFKLLCIIIIASSLYGCSKKDKNEEDSKQADNNLNVIKEYSSNPIITSIFTADPSAHVWEDGRIYIYASHDVDPSRGCDLMDRYHIFSSDDMVNWVDEGEILSSDDVSWGRPEGGFMWAPDCAYKDETYYFYYPHPNDTNWNDSWQIGIAVSNDPKKDFTDIGYIEGIGGFGMIDPCVYIDDDGTAYLYYGGAGMCKGGILNDDMISMKTELIDMEGLYEFHEGAWVFKRNSIYYMIYPDGSPHGNKMLYAISSNPLGPWEYQGVVLESTGCDTSHGSVVEYKGNWYLFYHNQDISGNGTLRSVAVDILEFDEDNKIKTVQQSKTGVANVGDGISEYNYKHTYTVDDAVLSEGLKLNNKIDDTGTFVTISKEEDIIRFENVDGGNGGRANIQIHYASGSFSLSKVRLVVNGKDYSLLNVFNTGKDWFTFTGTTNITVTLEEGMSNIVEIKGYGLGLNIDAISIAPLD